MLSSSEYSSLSMEFALFWVRIMKEHAIFIKSTLTSPLQKEAQQAEQYKRQYSLLLAEATRLSDGLLPTSTLQSGQFYTEYTEAAEEAIIRLTGIDTDSDVTQAEYNIKPAASEAPTTLSEASIEQLNRYILNLTQSFALFKRELLDKLTSCKSFMLIYPSDISHMLEEALLAIAIFKGLQNRDEHFCDGYREFWFNHMSGHANSIRGLLDPSEVRYISEADRFSRQFGSLRSAHDTDEIIRSVRAISAFKAQLAQNLLSCKVRSILSPLYIDHTLREANHYIYQLQTGMT